MRIAVVTPVYPPYKGGMGNVARHHAEVLASAGHEVTVFVPRQPGVKRQMSNVKCRDLRPLIRFGLAAWLPQLIWRLRGFDAVELHYPFYGGAEEVWLWKKLFGRRAKLVVLYHMDTVGRGIVDAVSKAYRSVFLKPVMRAADAVIVTSRDYFASSDIAWLDGSPKVVEIPLTAEPRFTPGGVRDPKKILFVGGLDRAHYFKGIDKLLEAFASLEGGPRLTIVGDGELKPRYEALAAELGIAGRVEFAGNVPDNDLPNFYRSAAFVVLPSVDVSEAFGLVTLEAAACGTPAIVSDLPGVRSVVKAGETGLVVPPGDVKRLAEAMRALLSDPARAADMGRRARRRFLEKYSSEKISAGLARLFG